MNKDEKQIEFETELSEVIKEIYTLLIEKNRKYKNSVLEPIRIFSKANAIEALDIRIDDKLSRISQAKEQNIIDNEDSELDLCGYLILKRTVERILKKREK